MDNNSELEIAKEREEIHREQAEKKYENRKRNITELVTAYYNKFDILQNKRLSEVIDKSLEAFLDTDMTIEEINEKLMNSILNEMRNKKDKKDDELDNMMLEEKTEEKNETLEKPKEFIKRNNNLDNRGIVHIRQLLGPVIVGIVIIVVIIVYFLAM